MTALHLSRGFSFIGDVFPEIFPVTIHVCAVYLLCLGIVDKVACFQLVQNSIDYFPDHVGMPCFQIKPFTYPIKASCKKRKTWKFSRIFT